MKRKNFSGTKRQSAREILPFETKNEQKQNQRVMNTIAGPFLFLVTDWIEKEKKNKQWKPLSACKYAHKSHANSRMKKLN